LQLLHQLVVVAELKVVVNLDMQVVQAVEPVEAIILVVSLELEVQQLHLDKVMLVEIQFMLQTIAQVLVAVALELLVQTEEMAQLAMVEVAFGQH
jgi:hypothetical protein